ncbi:MAG TPA: hypothetical protein VIW69_15430 [Candidatus Elarobacter sp.]
MRNVALGMKAVGRQRRPERLFDVLVRQTVFAGELLDGVADEKVEQDEERIEFHRGVGSAGTEDTRTSSMPRARLLQRSAAERDVGRDDDG